MKPRRRVAAVFLPQVLVECGRQSDVACGLVKPLQEPPRVVVWASRDGAVAPHLRVQQACLQARARGIRAGMTVAAARGSVGSLRVHALSREHVEEALRGLMDLCLPLAPVVMALPPDLLLLELSGTAHLFGGEAGWAARVQAVMQEAGHRVRVAVAAGPGVAQGLARYSPSVVTLLPPGGEREAVWPLPVGALGFRAQTRAWLLDAGLTTVGALAAQPRDGLARRLGPEARLLRLLDVPHDPSADASPLSPYVPPLQLNHGVDVRDHPVEAVEALLFVLKRAADALGARLRARGLAALSLAVVLEHGKRGPPPTRVALPLALPLWEAADMVAALRPLLERTELPAPVTHLWLHLERTVERPPTQQNALEPQSMQTMSPRVWAPGERLRGTPEDALPRLWAELRAELGPGGVGVLGVEAAHRPEAASVLLPLGEPVLLHAPITKAPRPVARRVWVDPDLNSTWYPLLERPPEAEESPEESGASTDPRLAAAEDPPMERAVGAGATRVLPVPRPLPGWPLAGELLGPGLGKVVQVLPAQRLWTDWWRPEPTRRDYAEVVLESGQVGLVFLDPATGKTCLQGWLD